MIGNNSSVNNAKIMSGSCSNGSICNISKKEVDRTSSNHSSSSSSNSNCNRISDSSSNKYSNNISSNSNRKNKNSQSSSTNNDPFAVVFDVFQSLLSATVADDDVNNRKLGQVEDVLSALTEKDLHNSAVSRLNYIRTMRKLTMKRLKSQFETESCKVQAVESIYYKADSACLRHKDVVSRRLAQQVQGTERRMKDLVFEIIGEYGKSEERLNRRQDYLLRAAQLKIVGKVTTLRWQRFLLSLCSQSTLSGSPISQGGDNNRDAERGHKISSSVLCSFNDFSEISLVTGAIREASQAAQHPVRVIAVIKLTRSQVPSKRRRISNIATSPVMSGLTPICIGHSGLPVRSVHSNSSSQLCRNLSSSYLISTAEEFLKVTEYLRSWMKPGSNSGKLEHSQPAERAGNSQDKKESDKSWSSISSSTSTRLLSSSGIEWLHPPSFFPSIWEQIHADELRGFHRTESNLRNREKDIEKDRGRERDRDVSVEDSKQDETRRISRFIDKFALQHSSFVSSDRVYFCLEERERAIATRHGKVQDPRRGGGRGEECPSPSLSLSEEQMMLKIYTHLQGCYSTSSTSPAISLESLRSALTAQPMYVTESCSRHAAEAECGEVQGPSSADGFKAALKAFPDIVQASSPPGAPLHFAPACPLNIMELCGLHKYHSQDSTDSAEGEGEGEGDEDGRTGRQSAARKEWIARMNRSLSVSYPAVGGESRQPCTDRTRDSSSTHGGYKCLDRLFCVVQVTPMHSANAHSSASPQSAHSPTQREREREREREESGSESDSPNAHARPLSYQVMMPLSDPCMQELVRSVLCAGQRPQDALQLLPDSACSRIYTSIPDTPAHGNSTSARSSPRAPDRRNSSKHHTDALDLNLNHKYILLAGSELSGSAGVQAEKNDIHYLVQLATDNEKDSGTETSGVTHGVDDVRSDDELLRRLLIFSTATPLAATDQTASPSPAPSPCHPQEDSSLRAANEILNLGTLQLSLPQGEASDAISDADARLRSKGRSGEVALVWNPQRWDTTVLSTLCRWRSCLCEARAGSSHLCLYHAELKTFLDRRASGHTPSEAAKYLPRKIPHMVFPGSYLGDISGPAIDSRKDLTMIRAASTLLQELWDGKLKATLRSFLSRTAHDMRFRRRLESIVAAASAAQQSRKASSDVSAGDESDRIRRVSNTAMRSPQLSDRRTPQDLALSSPGGTGRRQDRSRAGDCFSCAVLPSVPLSPVWAIWKDRDLLDRITQESSEMGALLVYILGTEKLISKELRSLFDMKVFPTQELLLIRKDLKAFKEKIANTKIDHKGNEIVERRASGQGQGQVSHSILDTDFNNSLTNCLSEQLLAERKLNLLTERRKHEEDARISHAKKMARIRAAQKTQSRDPSSFANQKRF